MNFVYSGRLQPLNKLNEKELLWICNNIDENDKLIIGIVNPNPQNIDPLDLAWNFPRFKIEFNQLSYWERHEIVTNFISRSNISNKVSAIIPLPRPSTNMENARNYLPKDRTMCLSIVRNDEMEESKEMGMSRQGEKIKKIPAYEFGDENTIISPELIYCLIAIRCSGWKRLVNPPVYEYLNSIEIENRVMKSLQYSDALSTIETLYRRATIEQKIFMDDIMKGDPSDLSTFSVPPYINLSLKDNISDLNNMITKLILEMKGELPGLEDDAPEQYKTYAFELGKLSKLRNSIGKENNEEKYECIKKKFDEINGRWGERKR